MRNLVLAALAVAAAAALAGCGGKKAPSSYTMAASRTCLTKKNVRVGPPEATDIVASTATGGAFRAHLFDNAVTVAFGQTLRQANNIAAAYVHFAAKNVGISDILRQQDNAVMLWHLHPSDTDLSLVQNCLR